MGISKKDDKLRKNTLRYKTCLCEAQEHNNEKSYIEHISELGLWNDNKGEMPSDRLEALLKLYRASHMSFKDIVKKSGLPPRRIAERFGIPYRTVQNWTYDMASCPIYILVMIQECLGLYDPEYFFKDV